MSTELSARQDAGCGSRYALVEVSINKHSQIQKYSLTRCGCGGNASDTSILLPFLKGKTANDLENFAHAVSLLEGMADRTRNGDKAECRRHLAAVRLALAILEGRQREPLGKQTWPVRIELDQNLLTIRAIIPTETLESND